MRTAGGSCDALSADVRAALSLSGLTSVVPGRLDTEAIDLERVGLVLITRAKLADGFEVDLDQVADLLAIDRATFREAVRDLQDPAVDPDGTPLLDLVAEDRVLFNELANSLREAPLDLPEIGTDPELDAAIARFDADILTRIQNGETIDPDDLSRQQRADLETIARALGGDDVPTTISRTENVRIGPDEYEWRAVPHEVSITEAGAAVMLGFVIARAAGGGAQPAAVDPGQGTDDGRDEERPDSIERSNDAQEYIDSVFGGNEENAAEISENADGTFDVEYTDPVTGRSHRGHYERTPTGYAIDYDYTDPVSGQTGSVEYGVRSDGYTRQETFPDGSTVTTEHDRFGNVTSEARQGPTRSEEEVRELWGLPPEGGENRNGIRGDDGAEPDPIDGDGWGEIGDGAI
ncbi:MAG: hypothetical protein AAF467_19460 [Actinomycetota bacterium]